MEDNQTNKHKKVTFFFRCLSLLSLFRGYNILVMIWAQYMVSIFILKPKSPLSSVLFDPELFLIVFATTFVIASGYIINNFYDSKSDFINKPIKSMLDDMISDKTKLTFYFIFNFVGVILGFIVSWRAGLFFFIYIYMIWLYSYKLKKFSILGWFSSVTLSIWPFFAVFMYYRNLSSIIFIYAIFLFILLLIRQLIKDLETMRGDFVNNYSSIPIKYGENKTKILMSFLALLIVIPVYFLLKYQDAQGMRYYFYAFCVILLLFVLLLWKYKTNKGYLILQNVLKLSIIAGIFSIAFIDKTILIERILQVL